MKLSISWKIVFIAAVSVVVSSVVILCISTILMSRLLTRTIHDDVSAMQSVVARMQQQEETRLLQEIQVLSTMPQLVDAVYAADTQRVKELAVIFWRQLGVDSLVIADVTGIAIARGHSDRAGDSLIGRPGIVAALTGVISSGILFEESAVLPYTIRCDAPIIKEDMVVGTLSLAYDIGTEAYVDNLQKISGMHFALFRGDTCLVTSVVDAGGQHAAEAVLVDARVTDAVFNQGETVIIQSDILGEPNMIAYWPVKDVGGNIIGMWAIAKPLTQQNVEIFNVLMIVILCSLGIMLFFVLMASLLGKKISLPIRKVTDYAVQVAGGNLDAPPNVRSGDEVGLLAGALQTMVATLKERIQEAEAANKAKSAFLSTMSHEIRTPMNAILGITEIQLLNEALTPDVREALEHIYTSGDLLLGIINDILDLSKIEAGKLELLINKYEIASLVSDTAQLNVMRIGSKPIEFELDIDENMPSHMMGDELRVKQILNNLLSNAFKYTTKGMVKLVISAEANKDNDEEMILLVRVRDTGMGMTKEQVNKLFCEYSRFNQDANRATEGTGLGMSITQNLVALMRGDITVTSEPDKGSVFSVRLPQGRVNSGILGREMAENLHLFRSSSRARMRRVQITREPMPYGSVLIVDDVELNIYVAKGLLTPYGLNIDTADSGYATMEKIRGGKVYDIIFMDHMMPELDGIETTKLLRDMGYIQPIVALTANAVVGQADIFLKSGFDDFISKPIDIRQMNVVLNKLIRDKQLPEVVERARQQMTETKMSTATIYGDTQPAMDPYFAEIFIRDAQRSLAVLDGIVAKGSWHDDEDLRMYTVHVHGLKSALANIKKMDLSAVALRLEQAARAGNSELIISETPAFLSALRLYVAELSPPRDTVIEGAETDTAFLNEQLQAIKTACEQYDENTAEDTLKKLRDMAWPPPIKELLSTLSAHLLHSDFEEASNLIDKLLQETTFVP